MPETDYLKIPQNRIGALIGNKGDVKKAIEKATETILDIDSEDGTVYITPVSYTHLDVYKRQT